MLVHIFLRHDGCFWKINLEFCETIVNYVQSDSIIFPKIFCFEISKQLLDLCLADSRILYFWQVLESTHKFIIELHAL